MKKIMYLFVMPLLFFNCKQAESENAYSLTVVDTAAISGIDTSNVNEKVKGWEYETKTNKMTSNKDKYCTVRSNESLNLEFPYNGINYGTLTVRRMNGEIDILIQVDKGQITGGYENEFFKTRFDDEKQITFSYLGSSDSASDVIFVENTTKFLKKLKSSKKILVQIPMYNNGNPILEFNTEGLKF
jgi:hypothetical protein